MNEIPGPDKKIRLKSLKAIDFKRFSNLTVQNIPESAKLIMLAGPNGSGKSSFFDAMNTWHRQNWRQQGAWDSGYHRKTSSEKVDSWQNDVFVEFYNTDPTELRERKKAFYFRSAYRNDPEFKANRLNISPDLVETVRINRMIENDAAVGLNYQRLASQGLEDVYEAESPDLTIGEFREKTIGEIKRAMLRVFPELELNSLGNPLTTGTFKFTKGASHGFLFKNLSGGEKAVFDLILDLVVARRDYDRTVFCIDEPESHMNTRLQADLLSVLYDLIPENCQLVLATHSIGMMRRARDIEREKAGSVVFLDFSERDFDAIVTVEPEIPSRAFWQRAYGIALDDLASLIAPRKAVICEGTPMGTSKGKNVAHDARCYNMIFEADFPDTRFVSGGNSTDVESDRLGLSEAIRSLVDGLEIVRLIDRDDQSDQEVKDQVAKGVKVLKRRNIESYLFADEVLVSLAASVGSSEKAAELLEEKKELLSKSSGPVDDLKPIRGPLYNKCKIVLGLTGCGNTAEAFMRDTLSPLVQPGLLVYEELKEAIFSKTN
jgi:predicted ATPase